MEFYSKKDAEYLMDYYNGKLIGRILESSTQSIVKSLFIEDCTDGKYRLMARGSVIKGNIYPKRDVSLIVKDLEMELPIEVLKDRDQHQ